MALVESKKEQGGGTMKRLIRLLISIPFALLGLVLLFSPYIALFFLASIITAGIGWFGFDDSIALSYLMAAWKWYLGFGIFTYIFLVAFVHQKCCVGLTSFGSHLKEHYGLIGAMVDIVNAIMWPIKWYTIDRDLEYWSSSFGDAIVHVLHYWFVEYWKNAEIEIVDLENTTRPTTYPKNPEEAHAEISRRINNSLKK